jgi:hypothetical protein|tara:strand:+ start:844 stop:1056 length:213 start_codon:yes stop_codon:yes gene_type:complete
MSEDELDKCVGFKDMNTMQAKELVLFIQDSLNLVDAYCSEEEFLEHFDNARELVQMFGGSSIELKAMTND